MVIYRYERSKQKQKASKIELITSSAELYFDRHSSSSKTNGVFVSTLISDQDIPGIQIEDICDNTNCCVKYTNNNYTLIDEQFQNTSEELDD